MRWSPPNIAEICPEQRAPLTQCSQTGFLYLALVSQLFGGSRDYPENTQPDHTPFYITPSSFDQYPTDLSGPDIVTPIPSQFTDDTFPPYGLSGYYPVGLTGSNRLPITNFDSTIPSAFELGQVSQYPTSSPIPPSNYLHFIRSTSPSNTTDERRVIEAYSHGADGSRGVSKMSFYRKKLPNSPVIKFNVETESFGSNPYASTNNLYPNYPNFDYEFNSKGHSAFGDIDTAFSKSDKITVAPPKNMKTPGLSGKSRRKRTATEHYDFIIVGAGSAGCVLANRLSEVKHWKILLLEAGPEEPDITSVPAFAPTLGDSSIDWQYRTQPEELTCRAQRGQTCPWFRGKVMGGSSAINYLVYIRGNKRDYDHWAELGNQGWSYNEVLKYFKKSENNRDIEAKNKEYHNTGGPQNVERLPFIDANVKMLLNSFKEIGFPIIDVNGESQLGTTITQTTSLNGERASSNAAFIKPIREKRSNLVIKTEALVTKVLINRQNKMAFGVEYIKNGVSYKVFAKREVILSAGALNSPKILMLSGIGPKQYLDPLNIKVIQNLAVGLNLQDHVTTGALLIGLSNKTSTLVHDNQLITKVENYPKSTLKQGPLSGVGCLDIVAFHRTEFSTENETVPDIQYHFSGKNLKEFYADPTTYSATDVLPAAFYDSIAVRPILLAPKSRGYITLNKTDPLHGQPLIYPRFFTQKADVDTLVSALRYALKLEQTKTFKTNRAQFVKEPVEACKQHEWESYDYYACILIHYTNTIFHPAGTCKMGPQWDAYSVVDPRLRVYGISHLRVADASIMPEIVRGNIHAPVVMIGEKASDMIKEDWPK